MWNYFLYFYAKDTADECVRQISVMLWIIANNLIPVVLIWEFLKIMIPLKEHLLQNYQMYSITISSDYW